MLYPLKLPSHYLLWYTFSDTISCWTWVCTVLWSNFEFRDSIPLKINVWLNELYETIYFKPHLTLKTLIKFSLQQYAGMAREKSLSFVPLQFCWPVLDSRLWGGIKIGRMKRGSIGLESQSTQLKVQNEGTISDTIREINPTKKGPFVLQ